MNRTRPARPQPPKRTHWPETTASHCYDWITPDDVVRLALGAYYLRARGYQNYPDDPTGEEKTFNNGRHCFAEDLVRAFQLKVDELGFKLGAPGFHDYATEALRKINPRLVDTPLETPSNLPIRDSIPDIHRALSSTMRNARADSCRALLDL